MKNGQRFIMSPSILIASVSLSVSAFVPSAIPNTFLISTQAQLQASSTFSPFEKQKSYRGPTSIISRRNGNINIGSNLQTLTSLQLFGFDNQESTKVKSTSSNTNTNNNSPTTSDTILQPGGIPTIVIDAEETSDKIYNAAIKRTFAWVAAAGAFGAGIFVISGSTPAEEFFAGYLLEQSLSIDNVLVFLLLFDYFKVPLSSQDRVLNFGIYGAFVMRAIMIGLGSVALHEFHGVLLVFAGILLYSSVTILFGDDDEEDEDMAENTIVQMSKNLFDSSENFDGDRFFTFEEGIKKATPLFICMIAVEISDVVFAVDSIPAVFGVTENPLIVFSSNMFAIMGLRSLYTILSKAASDLEYLEPAVAVVLGFVGAKLIGEYFGFAVPTIASLGVVVTMLSGGVGASLWKKNLGVDENSFKN